jgi:hypothetical protein
VSRKQINSSLEPLYPTLCQGQDIGDATDEGAWDALGLEACAAHGPTGSAHQALGIWRESTKMDLRLALMHAHVLPGVS